MAIIAVTIAVSFVSLPRPPTNDWSIFRAWMGKRCR